jgi:hypothetical protein
MHGKIVGYSESGIIADDSYFLRLKQEFESIIIERMREDGRLPIYELGTSWSTQREGDHYTFRITIYGSYVGRKKAQEFDFWCNGRLEKIG